MQALEQRASPVRKRQSSREMVNSTLSWSKRAQSSSVRVVGTDTQSDVPHLLADAADRLLHLAAQRFVLRQEKQVNIGMRKQCPATEAAQCDQREARPGARSNVLLPELQWRAYRQLPCDRAPWLCPNRWPRTPHAAARTPVGNGSAVWSRPPGWTWFSGTEFRQIRS